MDQEQEDLELETLLRQHLSERLDTHLGRAAVRLEREGLVTAAPPKKRSRFLWAALLAGTAVAASLALVLFAPAFRRPVKPDAPVAHGGQRNLPVSTTWWQVTSDEGVVELPDHRP